MMRFPPGAAGEALSFAGNVLCALFNPA